MIIHWVDLNSFCFVVVQPFLRPDFHVSLHYAMPHLMKSERLVSCKTKVINKETIPQVLLRWALQTRWDLYSLVVKGSHIYTNIKLIRLVCSSFDFSKRVNLNETRLCCHSRKQRLSNNSLKPIKNNRPIYKKHFQLSLVHN